MGLLTWVHRSRLRHLVAIHGADGGCDEATDDEDAISCELRHEATLRNEGSR